MKLFDAHCHLQADALLPELEKTMQRAVEEGVQRMICCGMAPGDWPLVAGICSRFSQVVPSFGIHPWFVRPKHLRTDLQQLESLLRKHPSAGIGETGLDFQAQFLNRAAQEESLSAHLDLAREWNRPVSIHCVRAWGRLVDLLRAHPAPRILLHAFSGSPELVPELVKLNCRFSFCGSVANPHARRVRAAAGAVPADRLLIETDSPDFTPSGCRPPNEPARLVYVARAVAGLRGVPVEEVACTSFANAEAFVL